MDKVVKLKFNQPAANAVKSKGIKIRRADRTGDTCLAVVDPTSAESVEIGENELNEFWEKCINEFGNRPPSLFAGKREPNKSELAWSRVTNPSDFDLTDIEEVLVSYPLVGG